MIAAGISSEFHNFILTRLGIPSQISPSAYLGAQEVLSVVQANNLPLVVLRLLSNCLDLTGACLDLFHEARDSSMKIETQFHPYTRDSSIIGADNLAEGFQETIGMDYSDLLIVVTNETLTKEAYENTTPKTPAKP